MLLHSWHDVDIAKDLGHRGNQLAQLSGKYESLNMLDCYSLSEVSTHYKLAGSDYTMAPHEILCKTEAWCYLAKFITIKTEPDYLFALVVNAKLRHATLLSTSQCLEES